MCAFTHIKHSVLVNVFFFFFNRAFSFSLTNLIPGAFHLPEILYNIYIEGTRSCISSVSYML